MEIINVWTIVGALSILGMVIMAVKWMTGWSPFARKDNPKKNNPSNSWQTSVNKKLAQGEVRIGMLENGQKVLFSKVNKIAEDVAFIRGKMEGK